MSRRIDIELTSARDDGTWTWRAAGAKQPKGVLEGGLLHADAQVGEVLRAEADFEVDGITVVSVQAPKMAKKEREVLPVLGGERKEEDEGVTVSLVEKRDRPPRRDRERGDRPDRGGRPDRPTRPRGDGSRDRAPRPDGADRPRGDGSRERTARPDRPARTRPAPASSTPAPPKPKRLHAGTVHRDAVLAALAPEERAVADHVLKGGIPAVRQAVQAQNTQLREAGQPEVPATAVVGLAEELLPRLRAAEWRDKAEAALAVVDEIAVRDLRALVAGADAGARDEESRTLAATLRQALDRRVTSQRDGWVAEVGKCLEEGRLVRALRLSSRPPDPATRVPAELAVRLTEAANAAMSPEVAPDRWAILLDAVAASPIRRSVKPAGLPAEPGETLLQVAAQTSGRVPALASLLGLDMPPPPGPRRPPPKPTGARRPPRPAPTAPVVEQPVVAEADVIAPVMEVESPPPPPDLPE